MAEVTEALPAEYAEVGGRQFGTNDLQAIFARLLDDPGLRYRDGDEIMAHATACLEAARAAMGDWFGITPEAPCVLTPVPDYLAADSPSAYYTPPAPDGSRPGEYHVNLHEPTDRGRAETASIAFHEAIPGHHLQLAIATERTDLPAFRRLSWGHTAFVEGWALYTERLADEMGLYESDLDRLGMLASDSWRACRLVVDTGLHARGWTRQQAIDFMVAHAPVSRDEIVVEVDRYIGIPGQALAYKVGQREILRLRAEARAHSAPPSTSRTSTTSCSAAPRSACGCCRRGWRAGSPTAPGADGPARRAASAVALGGLRPLLDHVVVHQAGQHRADDWRQPEHPELLERPPAHEHRRAGRPGRVHRRVGDRDADEVDERERQADGQRGEARRASRPVTPRMTSRKKNVSTTSATRAATQS